LDSITPGTVFQDRYEILSKLGEGGFGQVYRARQLVTHHEVAIKVLRAVHATNESHVARFQREMQLCAQLFHPNIVRLMDSGHPKPELMYAVFEYVPGQTLTDVLAQEGALPPWEAAHVMLQVLDALACAHNKGVIHRDLKPQNIMITTTGVRRNALVLDFGLGTLPTDSPEELARITRTREVLGTPPYAAPEQLRGETVKDRSDLYSWGLIFLECLTGQRAVDGATLQQVIYKQLGPEPIAVPKWMENHRLGRLLKKVTAKDPDQRDITVQAVMQELEACSAEGWPLSEAPLKTPVPWQGPLSSDPTIISRTEGERRQLTVVCCSLRLSSQEGQEKDEEDLDRLLRSLHATCTDIARRYDARVGGVLGEWVLFYFGYPQARENDARRAARAALEMVVKMEQRGAEVVREHKARLEFRAGIHTGLVISQDPRTLGASDLPALVGATPSAAVRLESRAEPGTVLISEVTSKLLRGHFAFEPVGGEQTGPRAAPVYRLLHEYRGMATIQAAESSAGERLFGRTQELDFLLQRWQQVASGTGQSIVLTGEPGIGKSRLVQELLRQIRSGPHSLIEFRCVPEGRNSSLHPVVDLLERLLGVSRDWTPEQTVSALEALLSQHGFELPKVMPLFLALLSVKAGADRYPPLAVSPVKAKELTLEALLELFFEMAQQHPLMLCVEDLHWADPTTLELFAQLAGDVSSAPICLVLTARPEFSVPWAISHHLQLSRLDRKGVEEMVGNLMRGKALPREVVDQLVNRTDGVPLFVEELTLAVVEALRSDTPSRTYTPSQIVIPSTLRDSLMARLDRLGTAREVAQLASALGREFSYELLKAITPREEAALQSELKALVDADLVHRRRGVRSPTYVFKHALIRDTAYESMLKPVRRQVHARIASTMEAHFPELVETRPDLLAMHHAAADQKRQALVYSQKAGMAALMRSANHEAVSHMTEALSWLDAVEDERERAQIELGLSGILTPALMFTRGYTDPRIGALVERSQYLIDFLGDSPQTVPTVWTLWLVHHTRGHSEQALAMAERLMSLAEQTGDSSLKVMALTALGNSTFGGGHLTEASRLFEQLLAIYDPAQHGQLALLTGLDGRAASLMVMSLVKWLQGYEAQATTLAKEGTRVSEEIKHAGSQGLSYVYLLLILQGRGAREQIIALADSSLEMAQRYGLPAQATYFRMFRSWATRDAQGLREALAIPDAIGQELGKTCFKALLADLDLEAGHIDASLELTEELIRWGRASGEDYMMANLLRLKGLCLRARGEREAAEASLREAIELARTQTAKMLEMKATVGLCELLRERGQKAEIRQHLAPLLQWFTEGLDMPDIVRARALLEESTT
jgi:TOMM system kinase/cyclase fusion protein